VKRFGDSGAADLYFLTFMAIAITTGTATRMRTKRRRPAGDVVALVQQ
jgi:hypothetical protein